MHVLSSRLLSAGLFAVLFAAGLAAAGDLLVRVEPASDADIRSATALNADFLARFDGWFLVRVRAEGLTSLSDRLGCRVLDTDIEAKRYVFACVEPAEKGGQRRKGDTILNSLPHRIPEPVNCHPPAHLTRPPANLESLSAARPST